jgi:hypothetical protein
MWDNAPQAHSRVSNINFDIWKKIVKGGLYKYPIKNISRTAKFAVLDIYLWDIQKDPPPQFGFKYQSWYLTPCCGLQVHYPTKELMWVKEPDNTFSLAKSGQELCRPWHIFYGIFIESRPSTICFQISKLVFDTLLWAWGVLSNLGT